jgi:UDP-N-acetylmuramoyl-tripeptide--D-alanyl-D-alanine ligase
VQLTAADIARRGRGEVVAGDAATLATAFEFDSRALAPGACFVALQGSRDGHDFVGAAFAAGASVALVARVPAGVEPAPGQAVVRVADPQRALHGIARSVREERDELAVVGVTGSSGKTSTKDLLHAALSTTGAVHANRDSFNNEVGLPLTLLGIDAMTRYVITEMGARFAGNIAELCAIAQPTVGVVTNIGLAHAEHLGGPEGVARVKAELVECLPDDGLAVLNADDPWSQWLAERASCEVRTVGERSGADVRITDVRVDDELRARCRVGDVDVVVPLRGAHQVHNAALAVVVAQHLGVGADDVATGLAAAQGSHWRMELDRSPDGIVVLNDAYNANPASMEAAVRALAHLPVDGKRLAVVGEMRELGDHAAAAHRAIGTLLTELGIDVVIGVGDGGAAIADAAPGPDVHVVPDAAAAIDAVGALVRPGDAVLVKASRAVGLEVVADALLAPAVDRAAKGAHP